KSLNKTLVFNILRCTEGLELSLTSKLVYLIPDPKDREDFAQDFFGNMCEKLRRVQIKSNVQAFIRTTVRNEALNFLDAKGRKKKKETGIDLTNPTTNPPTNVRSVEVELSVEAFLKEARTVVGEEKWEAIDLVYLQDYSRQEAADEMQIKRTKLNGLIDRGIQKLRTHFGQRFWQYFGQD
ncbi:MAG: sigma-70 family RNA polymerase sigma factor, partial [Bacteroidota bacterium]